MQLRLSLVLLLAAGCGSAADRDLTAARERITALEQAVARLTERTANAKTPPAAPPEPAKSNQPELQLDTPFTATCPGGWRELGAIGHARWSCRSTQHDGDGSWPQCHIVSLRYDGAWQPREFIELAHSLVPQLRSVDEPEIGPIVIETHPGFVATYARRGATAPQKALSSLLVEGDAAYVTICATSAKTYAGLEPTFRRVIESVRFVKSK